MTITWKESVSAVAATARVRDISRYTAIQDEVASPIDGFYNGRNLLLRAITEDYAADHPSVVGLVLVGLISETENYFRNIISSIIKICPLAKQKGATKSVNLATAWHGFDNMEKGAFENVSFSSADTVSKTLKEIAGYEVKKSTQIYAPLEEFNKLCELRHAIVHSGGFLAGKNAVRLQLPSSRDAHIISIGYVELQETAEVCTALVCSANLELFSHLANRWLHVWPTTPFYAGRSLTPAFNRLWEMFFSQFDEQNNLIQSPLTPTLARNLIKRTNAA